MLVNLSTILAPAVKARYGVACFNVFGWEDAAAVVSAAEAERAPAILAASLDFTRQVPLKLIAAMFRALAERAAVPVCAHLDHCYEIDDILRAVDLGFTSVMFDGSQLPLAENIAGTQRVRAYAHAADCSVEAEIGSVPYASGRDHIRSELSRVEDAVRVAAEAQPDALAISVGNIHRLQRPEARLDFALLGRISEAVRVPLVIHGSSGIPDDDLARLAKTGIAKFNIGTVLRQAFAAGLRETVNREPPVIDRHVLMEHAGSRVSDAARHAIRVLGGAETV